MFSQILTFALVLAVLYVTSRGLRVSIARSRASFGSEYDLVDPDHACFEEKEVFVGSYYSVIEWTDGIERDLYVACEKGIGGPDSLSDDYFDSSLPDHIRAEADDALVACCKWQAEREDEMEAPA
jgi:hypothetical protein